ncbi:unnamed protein product [Camellia sinensis]
MASRPFRHFVEQELGKFPHFVIYAILEWILIIFLFIDGFLAFISNEFAKVFELKIPCLLCTRIDHILVHKNSNSCYNDSICEIHKRDISSLAYCHVHRKLSDIRGMCEGCLLSFATEKESDTDTYKSLAGVLHKDIDNFAEDDQRVGLKYQAGKRDDVVRVEKSEFQPCSCCGEALKMRPSSKTMTRSSSINARLLSQVPAPSPRAPMVTWKNEDSRNLELPHIRLMALKFMSENESELPEDEFGSNLDQSCREGNKNEDIIEEPKTPSFMRGNRFFGIPLTDSASASPRFASRLTKKLQLEKSESFSEPNDMNAMNEAEGDSILHRLKRQVRLDHKSLIALYMELDEERAASAVAANNAMAMITRLQAEKASVQMEALQYQRMMEEQAEYDQEALQVLKDSLVKREDEIKVLEAELETYREKYGYINRVSSDECDVDADEDYQVFKSQSFSSVSEKSDRGVDHDGENKHNLTPSRLFQEESGERSLDESSLDFEGERDYLLGMLKNLEEKINESPGSDTVNHEDEHTGSENKAILTREVSLIRKRLRAIEADSGFLKHAATTLQKGDEGTKLLTEIALHLRKIRHSLKLPSEDIDA